MNDQQLLRYGRHILLNEFGLEAQECLLKSRFLVIGAGGLGSAALLYLASAGVGELIIADGDSVELSNLQRQVIHSEAELGRNKAESAAKAVAALNSACVTRSISKRLEGRDLADEIAGADLVLDCSDNFATRHAVNKACVELGKPLVSGAAIRFDGQIASFDPARPDSPCYNCLFPDAGDFVEERCAVMGVFAPLVGVIGALQASEAIRLRTHIGEPLVGRMCLFDGLTSSWHSVRLAKDPDCRVCGAVTQRQNRKKHAHA